jgi:glycosyltransferase involved in cell wall biosynthesis
VRILHLIDPASPGGGPGTLRLAAEALARLADAHHDVLIIGNSRHRELARRCGLVTRGRLGAPLNRPGLARRGLRSFLRACEPVSGRYHLVHAWTMSAAGLGALAAGRRPLLATAVDGQVSWADRRRLRAVPVLAGTAAVGRDLEAAGWSPRLLSLLPPGVDHDAIGLEQRGLLRERWGADATTFVVGLLGEPAARLDGVLAMNAVGRVALSGKDVRLVLHHEATARHDLRRWMDRLGTGNFVVVDDAVAEPWRVVAGLDAALVATRSGPDATGTSVLPMLWAMAAGVPVVAESGHAISGIIDEGTGGLLFESGDVNEAAACLLRRYDRASAVTGIAEAARDMIEKRFDIAGFAARLDAVYDQCVRGEPIRVPESAPRRRQPGPIARPTRPPKADSLCVPPGNS